MAPSPQCRSFAASHQTCLKSLSAEQNSQTRSMRGGASFLICWVLLIFHLSEVPDQILTLTHSPTYELNVFLWIILSAQRFASNILTPLNTRTFTIDVRFPIPSAHWEAQPDPSPPHQGFSPSCPSLCPSLVPAAPSAAVPDSSCFWRVPRLSPRGPWDTAAWGDTLQGDPPALQSCSCSRGNSPTGPGESSLRPPAIKPDGL